ncbi:hypothetical protein [Streptomyces olivochromogenes]|uniref:Uncharacterized protein n=1 Tax=Streptomyces olivochromogenes TaxID=1963 RepID=A0A250VPN4_STROL|nr:hypothetical protein [Streptomyces olivochromogenes]KUN39713.1 hypothetical protein AQJ27_42150 [Streptomyces olivochromogenes]GAX56157.1 hypothetical protein SO3561_07724 [Streptomyces olivochromogenes]
MDTYLTVVALLLLIAIAAYIIHRLNTQHAERIAVHQYSSLLSSRRRGHEAARPPVPPDQSDTARSGARRDHRDGGRGRFPPRRHRNHTTRNER